MPAWLPLLLIAAILLGGSYVRLARLGEAQFSMDEATHYFAAHSLAQKRAPLLPSGVEYVRGIDLAYLVGWLDSGERDHETALRLPTAVFGVLSLLLFAAVAWLLVGPWGAVWALLLFATFPELIVQSRNGRFYTYQVCFVIPAVYAGWRALVACSEHALRSAWLWTAATAALLLLGARVQVVTLSTAAGFGGAVAWAAAFELRASGIRDWRRNAALQMLVAGGVGLALLVAIQPGLVSHIRSTAFYVPLWAQSTPTDVRDYHWMLIAAIPVFYSLAPASFAYACARDWRLGVLLLCWFGIPFAVHSAVLPWKGLRFVLPALPALFLACGLAAGAACAALRRAAAEQLAGQALPPLVLRAASAAVVAVVALFAIGTTPAFTEARKLKPPSEDFDWRAAAGVIQREPDGGSLPIGSSMPLPALFYFGRLDFTVGTDYLEDQLGGRVAANPAGAADFYSGTPVLPDTSSIRAAFPAAPAVLIAIDPLRLQFGNVDRELVDRLRSEGHELCQGACRGLLLYRWALAPR